MTLRQYLDRAEFQDFYFILMVCSWICFGALIFVASVGLVDWLISEVLFRMLRSEAFRFVSQPEQNRQPSLPFPQAIPAHRMIGIAPRPMCRCSKPMPAPPSVCVLRTCRCRPRIPRWAQVGTDWYISC